MNIYVCEKCNSDNIDCIDSRKNDGVIRRRKKCANCGYRFTTYEIMGCNIERLNELSLKIEKVKELISEIDNLFKEDDENE